MGHDHELKRRELDDAIGPCRRGVAPCIGSSGSEDTVGHACVQVGDRDRRELCLRLLAVGYRHRCFVIKQSPAACEMPMSDGRGKVDLFGICKPSPESVWSVNWKVVSRFPRGEQLPCGAG